MSLRVAVALVVVLVSSEAAAVRFRRPFHPDRGLTAAFDNNRGGGLRDYGCGRNTYENHTGTDFGVYFTDILAMADATVVSTFDGCADYGSLGNTCGDRCGNAVRLRFDDGTVGLYCHLKRGSIGVSRGQRVGCGQKLAVSASSGSSTGPHLHVTWLRGGGLMDLYAGGCSNSGGNWTQQRGYLQAPGTDCERQCECSPGQRHVEGCGLCGTRSRTCGGDCRWGGWTGCEGQGPCAPGQAQETACCDCGRTRRTCNGACQWNGWSACAGPDPAGNPSCATGGLGVCAQGRTRCVSGCLDCEPLTPPSPETCDDLDNDCDGETDEGSPKAQGAQRAAFAAEVVDASFPRQLPPGAIAEAWVQFRNVGRETWRANEVWLRAEAPSNGARSPLEVPGGWAAHDVPAVLEDDVPPGAVATFRFPVASPEGGFDVADTFSLVAPSGRVMACPETRLVLAVASAGFGLRSQPIGREGDASPAQVVAGGGCDSTGVGSLVVALGLLARARRRARSDACAGLR